MELKENEAEIRISALDLTANEHKVQLENILEYEARTDSAISDLEKAKSEIEQQQMEFSESQLKMRSEIQNLSETIANLSENQRGIEKAQMELKQMFGTGSSPGTVRKGSKGHRRPQSGQ